MFRDQMSEAAKIATKEMRELTLDELDAVGAGKTRGFWNSGGGALTAALAGGLVGAAVGGPVGAVVGAFLGPLCTGNPNRQFDPVVF
jgi:outer membrane lipoprotein SlyB